MVQGLTLNRYILIVDDSPVDYEITSRSLRRAGIDNSFHHCESGDRMLDLLTGKDKSTLKEMGFPSLILLDLNLPGTDGKIILEKIKNHNDLRKIPVIVLTTSNNVNDVNICYTNGANSYIQKPIAPDDFVAVAKALKEFWFKWASMPNMERIQYRDNNFT